MKLTPETAAPAVAKLALMAFFPGDPDIRAALVSIFMEMIETEEQLDWLASRSLRLFSRWPGVGEIRAVYCSKYKPKDGIEGYSETYPAGIPAERPEPEPEPPPPHSKKASEDPDLDEQVRKAAAKKKLKGGRDK